MSEVATGFLAYLVSHFDLGDPRQLNVTITMLVVVIGGLTKTAIGSGEFDWIHYDFGIELVLAGIIWSLVDLNAPIPLGGPHVPRGLYVGLLLALLLLQIIIHQRHGRAQAPSRVRGPLTMALANVLGLGAIIAVILLGAGGGTRGMGETPAVGSGGAHETPRVGQPGHGGCVREPHDLGRRQ